MKYLKSNRVRWAALILFPVLLFVVMRHVNNSRPQTVLTALLAAMRDRDETALRQLTMPQGLAAMQTYWDPLRSDGPPVDWRDSWRTWTDGITGSKTPGSAFNKDRTHWVWFADSDSERSPKLHQPVIKLRTMLTFVATAQGWKLDQVELGGYHW